MPCDLMDGRDAFLTLSRDKHYEFSSLRRAKYSTMGLLYELHTAARDGFVYTCNDCRASVETRYHCTVCEVREGVGTTLGGEEGVGEVLKRSLINCSSVRTNNLRDKPIRGD